MYFIVETESQLAKLRPTEECFIRIVTNNDYYHPSLATPSLVYYNDGSKGYVLCVKHSESFSIPFSLIKRFVESHGKVYVLDKKYHSYFFDHSVLIDVNFTILDRRNETIKFDCDALTKKDFYNRFGLEQDVNEIVPISKHYESAECLYDEVRQFFGLEDNLQFYDDFCEAYRYVESQGIAFSQGYEKQFSIGAPVFFEKDSVVYSDYNLYNLTGRPTNSFNGLNFLSIPKVGEARSYVLPKNDFLVEFDFDGYHPRLIAELCGSTLSSEPVHEQLGKQYFNKESISEEEYQESKRLTFKQLYGSVEDRFKGVKFFDDLVNYSDKAFRKYRDNRCYVLPTGRTIIHDPEMMRSRLFNYTVQNYETHKNVSVIKELRKFLSNKLTQVVMVSYDAFLVDFSVKDGQTTLSGIKAILERDGMVVKHKYGRTYDFK
ncbi:MAG: hypothetical protein EBZ49_01230 [Proteobacteria bacterium]|nr:hypothetical protein [Pseudomonadota bacterium]